MIFKNIKGLKALTASGLVFLDRFGGEFHERLFEGLRPCSVSSHADRLRATRLILILILIIIIIIIIIINNIILILNLSIIINQY